MKTIKDVLHQMTDAQDIMAALRETLREIDPEFLPIEEKYQAAAEGLRHALGDAVAPSVSDYLAAREEEFTAEVIYIGWQGFQFNMDVFNNPINALLLNGDFEDLHRERRLDTLPAAKKPREVQAAFHAKMGKLPDEKQALIEDITGYYSYLATAGYKLAHYFGFRLADHFLHYVMPGYVNDSVVSQQYANQLRQYLQIDPEHME